MSVYVKVIKCLAQLNYNFMHFKKFTVHVSETNEIYNQDMSNLQSSLSVYTLLQYMLLAILLWAGISAVFFFTSLTCFCLHTVHRRALNIA